MSFVLDASIAAAWALCYEGSNLADRLLTRTQLDGAVVPPLWWYEIRNILIVAERRKRISEGETDTFLFSLTKLPIRVGEFDDGRAILRLARVHQLTVYDAAYLELASREHLPLGTLDNKLALAALPERVRVHKG